MPKLSREENERLDRLAGSGRGSGGGLPLPDLFAAMLNELLDSAPVSSERMTEIVSAVLSFKTEQVRVTWPTWEALTADVLAQIESRDLARHENGSWVAGDRLVTGQRLEVIPARPHKGSKSDGVTVWTREERKTRSSAAHRAGEATELAATLRPENRGLRPVDEDHVREIRNSVPEVGQLYPILVDQDGRVLDGKHRYAADPSWRTQAVKVDSDEMALAIALWANKGTPLPAKVAAKIESLILGAKTAQEKQRERVKAALLEQAALGKPLTHRAIAKRLDVSHTTIDNYCVELMATGCHYTECPHRFTEDGKEAPGPKPKPPSPAEEQVEELLLENPQQSDKSILATVGLSDNHHRIVERTRDRLEDEGAIPVVTAREGRDGTVRRVPHTSTGPRPSPLPASGNAAAENAWSRIMGRLGRLSALWRNGPPDAASELEELEALRREIDERIEALRR